jgi:hypothetical protein
MILLSIQELYSTIKILYPESEYKTCQNEALTIKWDTYEPVLIEVRAFQDDHFIPVIAGSVIGGEYIWNVRDPKYFNNPIEIKVINVADTNDYDMISNIFVFQETTILSQTQSAVYCEDEDANLIIDAEGFNLKYQWFRDDIILENENNNILNLSNLKYENSAVYQCEIIGELVCNTIKSEPIAVYVATPTAITLQPQHQGWSWGEFARFKVGIHINGNGKDKDIKFQWYKGYKPLNDGDGNYTFYKNKSRISGANSQVLEFLYLLPKDSTDSIYCVVTGRCGSVKTRFVKLQEDAFFKYKILTQEITACVGTPAVLKVQVTHTEPGTLIYEWYRTGNKKIYDNERISGATTPTLTIKSCIGSDLGTYVLRITHKESEFSLNTATISLYAESDPNIITKIKDYTVYDRRNSPKYYGKINLGVGSLLMVDKYYFQWFRNDTLIHKGGGPAGAILGIPHPTLSDEGRYYCIITGGCGVTYTDTFNVFLGYQDILLCQGGDTVLSVRKHRLDKGQMKYYWMFRNLQVKDAGRYEGSATCNLTVKSVTVNQEGEYNSYAIDTILNKTYKNGFVNLDNGTAPKIIKIYFNTLISMKEGMTAKKMMSVVTKKSMKIELYKDTLLYTYKYYSPQNWMNNEYMFYIGCNTHEPSCMAGVLPSGKYKFRFINDCGETWSNEFTIKNLDSTTGIVHSPEKDENTTKYTFEDLSQELVTYPETGINDNYNDEPVNIYPNPARDYIVIQPSESSDIQIFDMLGINVITVVNGHARSLQIEISKLSPGIYFIKIGNRIEKFLKM